MKKASTDEEFTIRIKVNGGRLVGYEPNHSTPEGLADALRVATIQFYNNQNQNK